MVDISFSVGDALTLLALIFTAGGLYWSHLKDTEKLRKEREQEMEAVRQRLTVLETDYGFIQKRGTDYAVAVTTRLSALETKFDTMLDFFIKRAHVEFELNEPERSRRRSVSDES